ncbi:hypothetical protein KDA14_05225 [Candidatus Saccharibacteria bacterium]|nr:hypothetical protein [Candidatus Saccharibacteria bacterium]
MHHSEQAEQSTVAPAPSNFVYQMVCTAIAMALTMVGIMLAMDSNPVYVWAFLGAAAAILFAGRANRSSWHPLRDEQSE